MTNTPSEVGPAVEKSARRPIAKADPTAEDGTYYLDSRVGGHRADVGFSDFKVDPYETDREVRDVIAASIHNLRPGDRRTQRMRADVGILVDLRRRGLTVYVDDSGPQLHITAHGAFAHAIGGMQCLSYSYFIGEPRFRVRRWLLVSPEAIVQCMHEHRATSLESLRTELRLLVEGVAPIANLAMVQRCARIGIPTPGGIFAGGFAPGAGLLLREYVGRECASLPGSIWQAHRELLPGREHASQGQDQSAATGYRERLVRWLAATPPDVGMFRAAGERLPGALLPGLEIPEEPLRAPAEVDYPARVRAPRESVVSAE